MDDIFCERLKIARIMRKLTQAELGEKAHLPPSSIAHFETGARKPSFDALRRLAIALDMPTDYLLGRIDEPEMPLSADILYRHMGKLSDNDRDIAELFLRTLAERGTKNA